MSRRVKREDFDKDIVDNMTSPKVEILKQLINMKYFDEEYKDDLSIAAELNISVPCFYKYQRIALELYHWNSHNYTNRRVMKH